MNFLFQVLPPILAAVLFAAGAAYFYFAAKKIKEQRASREENSAASSEGKFDLAAQIASMNDFAAYDLASKAATEHIFAADQALDQVLRTSTAVTPSNVHEVQFKSRVMAGFEESSKGSLLSRGALAEGYLRGIEANPLNASGINQVTVRLTKGDIWSPLSPLSKNELRPTGVTLGGASSSTARTGEK